MSIKSVLKAQDNTELLSYIINAAPELRSDIDLPVQGQDIKPIGKLIMSNERYKNAFINTINMIGLTVINRNYWQDPWETFTERGTLPMGQSVRELDTDIADVFDYNTYVNNATHFLETVVPNVYNYIHDLNYQKFYKTTTSDDQMALAFTTTDGLFDLIETIISSLWLGYQYDKYIVNKYMLCRRILDGTITSHEIDNYASLTPRQRVTEMKSVSNKMVFLSPNYNPAGLHKATASGDQILILDTYAEAEISTEVLATSFFRNDAEFKTRLAMIDGFNEHETGRLLALLGSQYVPFTDDELTALGNVAGVIVDREWFQNYNYAFNNDAENGADGTRATSFFNPETLKNNHWLHVWKVISSSPFKQAVVFTKNVTPAVSSVSVSPSTATTTPGQSLQLSASVATTGFANKAVVWSIDRDSETDTSKQATINQEGVLNIPSTHGHGSAGTQGTYYIKINTALATTDKIVIDGVEYTPAEADDTAAEQATAIAALFSDNEKYTVTVGTSSNADRLSFVEKSGYYGIGAPVVDKTDMTTGAITETTSTAGVMPSGVWVKATSVYDNTKSALSKITIS